MPYFPSIQKKRDLISQVSPLFFIAKIASDYLYHLISIKCLSNFPSQILEVNTRHCARIFRTNAC